MIGKMGFMRGKRLKEREIHRMARGDKNVASATCIFLQNSCKFYAVSWLENRNSTKSPPKLVKSTMYYEWQGVSLPGGDEAAVSCK